MLCEFERLIYPQKPVSPDNGFRIVKYRVCENLRDSRGKKIQDVKAVGYLLPTDKRLQYDLRGHWSRDGKYGVQFQVEDYQEVIAPTKEGIIAYLSSGKIKGIGPKMAEKIYAAFGPESLEIFEHHPERLLDIPGITSGKLEGILRTYLATAINVDSMLEAMNTAMESMNIGELVVLALESMLVSLCMKILSVLITVILYGRMIEIYLYTSVAPIPFATLSNREWGQVGNNYLRGLLALGFQGFFMMVCVGIYAVLVSTIEISDNMHSALFGIAAYTVILCFSLMKTANLSRSIFNAH